MRGPSGGKPDLNLNNEHSQTMFWEVHHTAIPSLTGVAGHVLYAHCGRDLHYRGRRVVREFYPRAKPSNLLLLRRTSQGKKALREGSVIPATAERRSRGIAPPSGHQPGKRGSPTEGGPLRGPLAEGERGRPGAPSTGATSLYWSLRGDGHEGWSTQRKPESIVC